MNDRVPLDKILEISCIATGNNIEYVLSKNRPDYLSDARFIFCRLARNEGYTLEEIGAACKRNHTTALYRLRQHECNYETDKYYKRCYNEAAQLLKDYIKGYITEKKDQIIDTPFGPRVASVTYRYHKCQ